MRNWNFPSTKRWQMEMMVHGRKQPWHSPVPGEGRGMRRVTGEQRFGTEKVQKGDRSDGSILLPPGYSIPLAQLWHRHEVLHRPVSRGCRHLLPQPQKASLRLGVGQKLLKNKKKTKTSKRKPARKCDLQAQPSVVKVNAATKTCQKAQRVGDGRGSAGAGKRVELACRQREGAKYPHKQVSRLKLIYLLKEHSAKPVINIFLPRLLM